MGSYNLGIDIGGTFVDAILFDGETGETSLEKAPSVPQNPSSGVLHAVDKLGIDLGEVGTIVHGTTLGLNAVLERRGARVGIITTEGFRDILELGRGDLPADHMYDMHYRRPEPLVQRRRIAGVPERINVDGEVDVALDGNAVVDAVNHLVQDQDVSSMAICCLHSYKNPEHERQVAAIAHELFPEVWLSVSHEVVREYREYERTCTTVLDAYIRPIFEKYIDDLYSDLADKGFAGRFLVMRSSGGAMTAQAAKQRPLDSVMSGPAGGIIGASYLAQQLRLERVLTMDFGGTSLDTCVIENAAPDVIHETRLQHMPVLIPTFDIRCLGAGGGSIAWLEEGMLRLGPQSAGAEPGPIAYGRGGEEPTLTDAALVLGYIDPDNFLGGELPLYMSEARRGLESGIALPMGAEALEAAAGIFSVLVAQTEGAVREITIEQGKDPKEFSILAFGGAGPLVAPLLALEMGIPSTIIPNVPAVFSAWGMLMADLATDAARTYIVELEEARLPGIAELFQVLEQEASSSLTQQGVETDKQTMVRYMEMRYLGQEHTLKLEVKGMPAYETVRSLFDSAHEQRYGHRTEQPLELVNLRVTGLGRVAKPGLAKQPATTSTGSFESVSGTRKAYCFRDRKMKGFQLVERRRLVPGDCISGPAIIDEGTSTTVIYTGQVCTVDDFGHLLITT